MTLDPALGDLERGDVLIEGRRIGAVGTSVDAGADALEIDVAGCVVLPGFVDTHRHTWQSTVRHIGADWTLSDYFQGFRGMLGWHVRPEDVHVATLLGRLEALDGGITTMLDWSHIMNSPEHADAAVSALKASRARSIFGYGDSNEAWNPLPSEIPQSEDARRVRSQWFGSDDQLVSMAMAIRGPLFTPPEIFRHDIELARDIGCPITVHVGDGLWGMTHPGIEMLDEQQLLGPDITFVHCNTNTDHAMKRMADTGATASVAPFIEMNMGHGFPVTGRLLQFGIRPSLSIDVTSVAGGDMFNAMRTALACERALVNDRALKDRSTLDVLPISTRDVLEFATIDGAATCGLAGRTGSITPGKEADLIAVSPKGPHMWPPNNPVAGVVMSGQPHDVSTVVVGGEVLKRDGRLVGVDLEAIRERAQDSARYLFEKAGLSGRLFDWRLMPDSSWTGGS